MKRIRLKQARKELNLTIEAMADLLSVSTAQISRWENGINGIPSQRVSAIAAAYRLPVSEVLDGADEIESATAVMIELLPTIVGAGGGGTGEGDYQEVAFSRNLIENEIRIAPDDLLAICIEGDSAVPEFYAGDQVLIDKRKRSLAQPGPFCIWDGDGYVIKWIERVYGTDPPAVRVMSKNTQYPESIRLEEEIRVMGRPVWFGRRYQ